MRYTAPGTPLASPPPPYAHNSRARGRESHWRRERLAECNNGCKHTVTFTHATYRARDGQQWWAQLNQVRRQQIDRSWPHPFGSTTAGTAQHTQPVEWTARRYRRNRTRASRALCGAPRAVRRRQRCTWCRCSRRAQCAPTAQQGSPRVRIVLDLEIECAYFVSISRRTLFVESAGRCATVSTSPR